MVEHPIGLRGGFLWVTGGSSCVGNFLDKVGGQIERDRSPIRLGSRVPIAATNTTLPKKIQLPGQKPRTSIWTKVTNLKWARRIAKDSGLVTIYEGTIATGDIGRGLFAWWYDVKLD